MGAARFVQSLTTLLQRITWRRLRVKRFLCPICRTTRTAVKLGEDETLVRCMGCKASAITLSMAAVLARIVPDLESRHVYELSARGALVRYLQTHAGALTCSELLDGVAPGTTRDGVLCQDVQALTFSTASFDVCTSTEVFEHVPDDHKGLSEIHRVLRPGGVCVFTAPLLDGELTVERARLTADGRIEHVLSPEYHRDPIRGHGPILAFRTYGRDLLERLARAGFARAEFVRPDDQIPWGYARTVVVGYKGE